MSSATTTAAPRADLTTWEIDAAHSSVHFSIRHMMVSNVRGEFTRVAGNVRVDPRDITRSTIEAVIDAASISTRDEKRDEHLRSADFLDVANYPTIEFKSTRLTRDAGGSLKLAGNLTIHGVTHEVVLDVEDAGTEVQDPWGNTKRGASATTRLNRRDFGLQWNVALETGGILVGDELKVEIDVELLKK
ncbi:MAG: YceI family protein [Gemmatimonadales bacterium]